jgi:hypothetical protein
MQTATVSPDGVRKRAYSRHAESSAMLAGPPERLFTRLDDHSRLASHMNRRSWRTGWGRMELQMDETAGKAIGAHLRLNGRVLGLRLEVDEVVREREPPCRKVWETVGDTRLLVIGPYRMGFEIRPERQLGVAASSVEERSGMVHVRIFIDYELPAGRLGRMLGRLLGGFYARWCTKRMLADARAGSSGGGAQLS